MMCSIAAEGSKASTITFMLQVQSGSVYSLASAPETRQSSPRAPQDLQDALGATKPQENQQKRTQNNIKQLKTTETNNIPTLSVQFSCSIS